MSSNHSHLPFVSVIIPVFRQWGALHACLKALEHQTYPRDKFEVLIVNNGDENDLPEALSDNLPYAVFHEPKPGSYAARNTGLKNARGEIIAFTDSDCLPAQDWIANAVKAFTDDTNIARLAGNIDLYFRRPNNHSSVELFEMVFAFQQEKKVNSEGSAITANMFTRRKIFDEIGLFDERLRSGGDSDWGIRAKKAGFKILFAPNVRVSHPARYSWGQLYRKTVRLYGGKWLRAKAELKRVPSFFDLFSVNPPGMSAFKTVLNAPMLSTLQRVQVMATIGLVALIQILEYFRLSFGGSPRRE